MKHYNISLPVVVEACCQVEAESEEEAIELALEWFPGVKTLDDPTEKDGCPQALGWFVNDGGAHKRVVQGNVYYGCIREACAEVDE